MTTSKQIQNKPIIAQYLEQYKSQIASALPRHMTADRMARIVLTEVRKVPKLLKCNPASLFGAVVQASQLGLEPGSALGHCYLIPYGKDVNLIIGYQGMIDLARRSGQIVSIEARAVYGADEFSFEFGLHSDLIHKPAMAEPKERGGITHFYAVAKLQGGGVQWDVMSKFEVNEVRDGSTGYKSSKRYGKESPWDTHYQQMGKKTVIRRLFKYLPVSVELRTAINIDEMADSNISQQNSALIDGEYIDIPESDAGQSQSKTQSVINKISDESIAVDPETGEVIPDAPDAKEINGNDYAT